MSVYRDSDQSPVVFTHPVNTAQLTATVTDSTGATVDTATISLTNGVYTYPVPWKLTQYDAKYTITWTNTTGFKRTQTFQVITPLVTTGQLQTVYANQSPPPTGDLVTLEQHIRLLIQSYTGQAFGYSYGAQNYTGNGTGKLALHTRLAQMTGILGGWAMFPTTYQQQVFDSNGNPVLVNGNPTYNTNLNGELNLDRAAVIQDGWDVLIEWPEYLSVREAPPEELVQFAPSQDGTIRVPRRYSTERDLGTQYTITGYWGYDAVPDDIQEAALLLANDYVTNDSQYRDRYLNILKIQQDSFTYHNGAFRGTGNARVDLLLGPYRRKSGMIIL